MLVANRRSLPILGDNSQFATVGNYNGKTGLEHIHAIHFKSAVYIVSDPERRNRLSRSFIHCFVWRRNRQNFNVILLIDFCFTITLI